MHAWSHSTGGGRQADPRGSLPNDKLQVYEETCIGVRWKNLHMDLCPQRLFTCIRPAYDQASQHTNTKGEVAHGVSPLAGELLVTDGKSQLS